MKISSLCHDALCQHDIWLIICAVSEPQPLRKEVRKIYIASGSQLG